MVTPVTGGVDVGEGVDVGVTSGGVGVAGGVDDGVAVGV